MAETLQGVRARQYVGRRTEIDELCEWVQAPGTSIAAVHGILDIQAHELQHTVACGS